ncbi:MAG: glycosyltransferase family 2 protein [Candidatus Omnitrophota bacterium]
MEKIMDKNIKVSVVMPTFNEEKAIGKVIEDIRTYTKGYETEIVIVDSSSDSTVDIAKRMGVKVLAQKPQGHGIALRTAIKEAKNDIIITADCDNTYPMSFIPKLVELSGEYDLVSCNRLNKELKKEMPFMNRLANMGFAFLVRLLYGINVHDVSTGMFCIRKNLKESINWETNYSLPCEIIVRTNLGKFKHKEIDIPYKIRIGEVKLQKLRSGIAYLKCIFNYRFGLKIDPKDI